MHLNAQINVNMRSLDYYINESLVTEATDDRVKAIIADIKKKFKKPDEQDIAGYIFDNDLIDDEEVMSAITKTFKISIEY